MLQVVWNDFKWSIKNPDKIINKRFVFMILF